MRSIRRMLATGALLVAALPCLARAPVPPAADSAATLATVPMSRQIDFTSAVNGRRYRIQIALPLAPPPPQGFKVLYVLDGDGYFGGYAAAVRLRAMAHEIEPAVVVGIGYPDAERDFLVAMQRRNLDLTPAQPDDATQATMPASGAGVPEYGGADAFLRVIETEIKPRVRAVVATEPGQDILFGHSLGGLFVLHALFTQPASFRTYLALSPSIWWSRRAILDGEAAFAARVADRSVAPRLYIAVGGGEQSVPPPPYPPGMTRQLVESMVGRAAMVDNARGLGGRLGALDGAPGWEVRTTVYDGESHLSVAWRALNAFLDFALPPPAAQ